MNTPDRSLTARDPLSIAELETRFEMEVIPVGAGPVTDWSCTCTLQF